MNLFKQLKKDNFIDIQKKSNEKERKYLDIITDLQTEFEKVNESFLKEMDIRERKLKIEIDVLTKEKQKLTKTVEALKAKHE